MGRFFSFLAGSLVGAILGVTAVVMLTPVSGKEVRNALRRELSTIVDEGRKAAKARQVELEQQLRDLRGETSG